VFFDDLSGVFRTLLIGTAAYVGMVAFLRVSGKRTLSKMNAFDLVVTVALGSSLANVLLDEGVDLLQGLVAFALLIALQYLVTWSGLRFPWVRRVVTGEPRLLALRGRALPEELRRARIAEDELQAGLRAKGFAGLDEVEAVVLETDGSLSVLGRTDGAAPALEGVVGGDAPRGRDGAERKRDDASRERDDA
jgi:uncharacterized membrane protein YcaP (DUF421 family)